MISEPTFWWDCPKTSDLNEAAQLKQGVHTKLFPQVREVEERQHAIHRLNLFNAKLYSSRHLMAIDWNRMNLDQHRHAPTALQSENLICNVVDAATAMVGKNKLKATPVVRDADFTVEREARKLDRYLWAEATHQKLHEKMQRVFNDCLWAQIGALKIDIDGKEIYTERVMPDEIIVDQRECIADNMPLQVHQRKLISKVQLAAKYPKYAKFIEHETRDKYTKYRRPPKGYCVIIESWFLGLPGHPGRHVLCTENFTIVDEEYTRDRFPFIFQRWSTLPTGFYGKSLVEELTPYQLRQNEINRVIKIAQDLMCVPRIFVEAGSRFIKSQLDNEICRILQYKGQKPEVMQWSAVGPELYAERDRNSTTAFQFAGMSQMFAQSAPAQGVRFDSSKALREHHYTNNERFAPKFQMHEAAYLEAYDHYVELSAILGKDAPQRKWRDQDLVDTIQWDEINLDREKYVLELQVSSVLNMTPAAREDQLKEWALTGRIDVEQLNGLSGNPDLEGEESIMTASMDDIKATCEQLDKGENPQPDYLQNLTYGLSYIHKKYLKRRRQKGVPKSVLQGYRDWLTEAQAILEDEQAKVAQTQAALAQQNMGPDGTPLPAQAVTSQGVPTQGTI